MSEQNTQKKIVYHKQIYRKGAFGGTLNTSLCGRINNYRSDKNGGMNVGDDVTCKFCLKIIADPKHWRNKNIMEGEKR